MNTETATAAPDIHEASKEYWRGRTDAVHRHSEERWFELYAGELLALLPRGGTLLDVGCGSCQLTTYLAPAFEQIVAIDFSESMIEAARQRSVGLGLKNLTLAIGDATHFPAAISKGDVILAHGVLQYLDEAALTAHLVECARVLAPDGTICWGMIPNARLRWMWYLRLLNGPRPPLRELARRVLHTWRNERRGRASGDKLWDGIGNWFEPAVLEAKAGAAGFDVEIRHSWFYEYRFHLLLKRSRAHGRD